MSSIALEAVLVMLLQPLDRVHPFEERQMAKAEHTENLSRQDAVAKIEHIATGETAMLCTFANDEGRTMATRPMATLRVDPDGTVWFMSRKDSHKNREIAVHPTVQLVYAIGSRSEYLSLEGTATITREQAKIDELWTSLAKTWFPNGKTDPLITLIAVKPSRGYYWDTKHGKMIAFAGMLFGALTGEETDDSVEGTLKM